MYTGGVSKIKVSFLYFSFLPFQCTWIESIKPRWENTHLLAYQQKVDHILSLYRSLAFVISLWRIAMMLCILLCTIPSYIAWQHPVFASSRGKIPKWYHLVHVPFSFMNEDQRSHCCALHAYHSYQKSHLGKLRAKRATV